MILRVTVNVMESADVEIPDEIVEQGEDAIYEYLHDLSGSPWGNLKACAFKIHDYYFEVDEEVKT